MYLYKTDSLILDVGFVCIQHDQHAFHFTCFTKDKTKKNPAWCYPLTKCPKPGLAWCHILSAFW